MYCRICRNVRQKANGELYCRNTDKNVGLNQVCIEGKFELDKRIVEEMDYLENKER